MAFAASFSSVKARHQSSNDLLEVNGFPGKTHWWGFELHPSVGQ
jgi:hypothetical protein